MLATPFICELVSGVLYCTALYTTDTTSPVCPPPLRRDPVSLSTALYKTTPLVTACLSHSPAQILLYLLFTPSPPRSVFGLYSPIPDLVQIAHPRRRPDAPPHHRLLSRTHVFRYSHPARTVVPFVFIHPSLVACHVLISVLITCYLSPATYLAALGRTWLFQWPFISFMAYEWMDEPE
ncbi:hypothetical protein C8J57DRAFT_621545 [Mycena rebaudengoi]|nr:hypothetical protein C8J57DRAFT_621545 [Mycena rebaudengoi]